MALSTDSSTTNENDTRPLSLAGGIAGTVGLRVFAAGAGLLSSILLARYLGAHGLGMLSYASAWAAGLLVVSTLGFNQLLVRNVAIHRSRKEWSHLAALLRSTTRIGVLASVCLVIVGALAASWATQELADKDLLWTFLIAFAAVPIATLIQFRQSAMRGLKRVNEGLLPDMVVRPVLSIAFLTAAYFYFGQQLSAPQAATMSLVAAAIAFLLGDRMLRQALPAPANVADTKSEAGRQLAAAFPLCLIAVIQFINLQADLLMLGYLAPIEEVGFYAVAKGLTETVIFVLLAVELTVAPRIAEMYAGGKVAELQELLRRSAGLAAVSSIPVALLLLFRGEWVLILYGHEFIGGLLALQILCSGQIINVLCGPIGQLAIHTGHARATTCVVALAAAVNVLLNWVLIPEYGAAGAAAATAVSLAIWNIGLLVYIRARTGLSALPIPVPPRISRK